MIQSIRCISCIVQADQRIPCQAFQLRPSLACLHEKLDAIEPLKTIMKLKVIQLHTSHLSSDQLPEYFVSLCGPRHRFSASITNTQSTRCGRAWRVRLSFLKYFLIEAERLGSNVVTTQFRYPVSLTAEFSLCQMLALSLQK